jgi:erythromycin esterase-like protein
MPDRVGKTVILVDEVVCATTPSPFVAVGRSYWNFSQTTDEEVRDLLRAAATSAPAPVGAQDPTEVAVIRAAALPTSHVGDVRATEAAARGEFNVGQLVRERYGTDCRKLGFTTYSGTVTAADDWGGPAQRKWVRPALSDSVEELFHEVGQKEFLLVFDAAPDAAETLRAARLERAIGVIYRPETAHPRRA